MLQAENKALVRRSWEIVSARNADALDEVYTADASCTNLIKTFTG